MSTGSGAVCLAGVYRRSGPERVHFGVPVGVALADEVDRHCARRVFVVSSASQALLAASGQGPLHGVHRALADRCVGTWSGMRAHSPLADVLAAATAARAARVDLLVAVGGGSVIDGAKAVLPCLWHGIDDEPALRAWRRDEAAKSAAAQHSRGPRAFDPPLLAVSTMFSATEFTASAGITDPVSGDKLSFRHSGFVPQAAVLDPACTLLTPLPLLLASGLRAVDHAIESYCAPTAHAGGQLHAMAGWRALASALPAIQRDPTAPQPRLEAQFGLWQAILGAATGAGTGASHGIGYALGAGFGVSHGHTSCVMLPAVLRFNAAHDSTRQHALAAAVGRPDTPLADLVESLVRQLGLPSRLREIGIRRDQWPELAHRALRYAPVAHNPRPVTCEADLLEILAFADGGAQTDAEADSD